MSHSLQTTMFMFIYPPIYKPGSCLFILPCFCYSTAHTDKDKILSFYNGCVKIFLIKSMFSTHIWRPWFLKEKNPKKILGNSFVKFLTQYSLAPSIPPFPCRLWDLTMKWWLQHGCNGPYIIVHPTHSPGLALETRKVSPRCFPSSSSALCNNCVQCRWARGKREREKEREHGFPHVGEVL